MYVVELDAAASNNQCAACVYVGETALSPQERWERHRQGGRTASRVVTRFGLRLRPDLAADIGPFNCRTQAEEAEAALAAQLRRQGFVVFGGQGRTFRLPSPRIGEKSRISPERAKLPPAVSRVIARQS